MGEGTCIGSNVTIMVGARTVSFTHLDVYKRQIVDGSSKFFFEAIDKAGIEEQNAAREYLVIKEVLNYVDPVTGSELTIIPSDTYEVTTMVDFGTKVLGTQNATLKDITEFKDEISTARTFSFLHELEMLLDAGSVSYTHLDVYKRQPYNSEKQPIYLLQKNGEKITLENSENQILSSSINQLNTKYILSFPREI